MVTIHDMGEPNPAESWRCAHAKIEREDRWSDGSVLYFVPTRGETIIPALGPPIPDTAPTQR
jgi:hypothetical protein